MSEDHHNESNFPEKLERPVECSECRRKVVIHYSQIVNGELNHIGMCDQCPQLQQKLFGQDSTSDHNEVPGSKTGLACGECGTSLDSVRMGSLLGCSVCYEVFSDVISHQLLQSGKLPKKSIDKKRTSPFHIGRSPGAVQEMSASLKILALNEALDETLKKEDYEQAALLRDQIEELTKEKTKRKKRGKKA